jgi:hypothetical protein
MVYDTTRQDTAVTRWISSDRKESRHSFTEDVSRGEWREGRYGYQICGGSEGWLEEEFLIWICIENCGFMKR